MKAALLSCLVLFALVVSSDALNLRAKVTRRAEEQAALAKGDGSSHSSQATINKKLGFAFVLDNGNDIETVQETKAAHKIIEENKKQGSKEANEKQTARDNDFKSKLDQIKKENDAFATKASSSEEGRKKAAEQTEKQGDKEADEAKQKREGDFDKAKKSEDDAQAQAEQQEKAEKKKQEEAEKAEQQKQEVAQKGIIRDSAFTPQKGQILKQAADIRFTGSYTYMFWVKALGSQGPWTNVMHKGQANENRNPAIWFYPGQTRLHCRSGNSGNWNEGCDPDEQLPVNQWTHFTLTHDSWGVKIYLNGNLRCQNGIGAPIDNSGPLYVSDPWHDPANTQLADFRQVSRVVSNDEIAAAVKARTGVN